LLNKGGMPFSYPDTVMAESLVLQLQKVQGNQAELGIKESNAVLKYITLKAYKFPFINLVWAGTLITVLGFFISAYHRRQRKKIAGKGQGSKKEEVSEAIA